MDEKDLDQKPVDLDIHVFLQKRVPVYNFENSCAYSAFIRSKNNHCT